MQNITENRIRRASGPVQYIASLTYIQFNFMFMVDGWVHLQGTTKSSAETFSFSQNTFYINN